MSAPRPSRPAATGPRRSRRQRELGQNFLVDQNILGVIERLAAIEPQEVVLEVGGGEGVLSERLAVRARHLHVVELDPRLRSGLEEVLRPFPHATLHMADALQVELATLEPPPEKLVANLPYGVAATVILRTIEELPTLQAWLVMVQREVGERLAAAPGSSAYGITSVLAQIACKVRVLRRVPRTVFRPVPNVDSVLVGLKRHGPAAAPEVTELVRGSFAHRRKPLAGSLALAAQAGDAAVLRTVAREKVHQVLVTMGHRPDERAERLAPQAFVELAERLAR